MIQRPASAKETLSGDMVENISRQEVESEDDLQNLSLNEEVLEERNGSVNQLEEVELNIPEESNAKFMYECEKCGKRFTKKSFAKVHCRVKVKATSKCEICGLLIKRSYVKLHKTRCTLKKERVSKQAPAFTCSICGKEFSNQFNMIRHSKKKHGIIKLGELKCQVPDCSFSTNSECQMKGHTTKAHTGKTVKCKVCGFGCTSDSGMSKHMIAIHGFECKMCGKLFSTETRLHVHTRMKHEIQDTTTAGQVVVSRIIGEHASFTVQTVEDSS